jgi:ABC-2 type transport system permease protein
LTVRWIPRHKLFKQITIPLAAVTAAVGWYLTSDTIQPLMDKQFNIAQIIPGLNFASQPFNPGWWVSEGIMACSHGEWARGAIFLMALTSSALMATMLIEIVGKLTFYNAWQKTIASGRAKRKSILLPALDRLARILPHDISAIIIKDIRTFFRDPSQWSQALVFFGLLAFYFANLRTLNYNNLPDIWRIVIAFLNIFAVSAVMSSLGSRFIYPQLSLEGHGFWLLGLSPVTMKRIIVAKFILAFVAMTAISTTLIWLSSIMLATSPAIKLTSIAIISCIAITVCGVSTGLGAYFLDIDQRNPAAIVSGFGGTLNLIICLSFLLLAIMPFGILFHLAGSGTVDSTLFRLGLRTGFVWLAIITLLTTGIPMYLGLKSMQNRDY